MDKWICYNYYRLCVSLLLNEPLHIPNKQEKVKKHISSDQSQEIEEEMDASSRALPQNTDRTKRRADAAQTAATVRILLDGC